MLVLIEGHFYDVAEIPPEDEEVLYLYMVAKLDGDTYQVSSHEYGHECTCGDFEWKRNHLDKRGCKHIRALIQEGLL